MNIDKKSLELAIKILVSNLRGQLHLSDGIYFVKYGQNLAYGHYISV